MNIRGYEVQVRELKAHLGGGYIAYAPALKGCVSDGESRTISLLNLEDAMHSWIAEARAMGRTVPEPLFAAVDA